MFSHYDMLRTLVFAFTDSDVAVTDKVELWQQKPRTIAEHFQVDGLVAVRRRREVIHEDNQVTAFSIYQT